MMTLSLIKRLRDWLGKLPRLNWKDKPQQIQLAVTGKRQQPVLLVLLTVHTLGIPNSLEFKTKRINWSFPLKLLGILQNRHIRIILQKLLILMRPRRQVLTYKHKRM